MAVPISPFFIDREIEALSRSQWQSEDLNLNWSAGSQASPFHHAPVQSGPQAQGHHKGSTTPLASPSNQGQSPIQGCLSAVVLVSPSSQG